MRVLSGCNHFLSTRASRFSSNLFRNNHWKKKADVWKEEKNILKSFECPANPIRVRTKVIITWIYSSTSCCFRPRAVFISLWPSRIISLLFLFSALACFSFSRLLESRYASITPYLHTFLWKRCKTQTKEQKPFFRLIPLFSKIDRLECKWMRETLRLEHNSYLQLYSKIKRGNFYILK